MTTMRHKRRTEAELRLEFTVYCIESIANRLKTSRREIFRRMSRVGLVQDFIRNNDPLHTQSIDYAVDEILEALAFRESKLAEKKGATV